MRTRKRLLSLLLCGALLFSLCPQTASAVSIPRTGAESSGLCEHHTEHNADCGYTAGTPCGDVCEICGTEDVPPSNGAAEGDVTYLYFDENNKHWATGTKQYSDYKEVNSSRTNWGANDDQEYWYVVNSPAIIGELVTVTGNVHLILADDTTLVAMRGIQVAGEGNSLTIYAQSDKETMGALTATGGEWNAGIGGIGGTCGTITINGGKVTASGGTGASDIGGGKRIDSAIAPTDKIEIGPGTKVTNGDGKGPDYGLAHGSYTSQWEGDENDHWHPCGYSDCDYPEHQFGKETHSFGDWETDGSEHWKRCEICNRRGSEGSHVYDQETVKPGALKSEANCKTPATYYKSCVCGEVGADDNETFTSGNTLAHNMTHHAAVAATCTKTGNVEYWSCSGCNKNFSNSTGTAEISNVTIDLGPHDWDGWISNGNGTHTRTCQRDTSHTEKGDCSGGTATCSAPAICSTCGGSYGNMDSSNHTGGTEVRDKKDPTTSSEGYTGDTYCLGCNEKIATGTTIPKLNGGGGSSGGGSSSGSDSSSNTLNSQRLSGRSICAIPRRWRPLELMRAGSS